MDDFVKPGNVVVKTNPLVCYSFHDCKGRPNINDFFIFKGGISNINYPCLIFIRANNWNDYSHVTHFETFYLPDASSINDLGYVVIIQSKAKNFCTVLPDQFEKLPSKEFFSKGFMNFYNNLKPLGNLKNDILYLLNDVYFNHYTKEQILEIDNELRRPYENSLFRDDFYDLEVSSDYAKNSLDVIDKIENCARSISKFDESEQKIIAKLLYGSVITTLESYLGDAFKYNVFTNDVHYHSFLKNYTFTEKKYEFRDLALESIKVNLSNFISLRVKEIINNMIFHRLDFVIPLYKQILNVDLPKNIMDFREPIQNRHHIFHRNGKNIAGEDLDISYVDIFELIQKLKKFISETERIMAVQI